MMRDDPLVSIRNLRVTFRTSDGPVAGLRGASFDIRAGECTCIVGESGSGKSAAALSLMRLVEFGGGRIDDGRLMFDGADLARADGATMRRIRGNRIAMVFQEPMTALNPVLTIARQLAEAVTAHRRLPRAAARARALDLLAAVGMPDPAGCLAQYPHELSGGMRQRVVIAMAMACAPRLLICDEPTSALDAITQARILALIDRLRRDSGMAVLLITHDMAVAARMASHVVVMQGGRVIEQGPVGRILAQPRQPHTRALLAAMPRLGAPAAPAAPRDAPPLLRVENLCVGYAPRGGFWRRPTGPRPAVQDVSLTIAAGETLALVGASGCGKTSTARAILRLIEPASGRVHLAGQDIRALGPAALRQARRRMQMIFQDPFASLDPQMTVGDQVEEPLLNYGIGTPAERRDRVAGLFDRVQLPRGLLHRYPHELSGGQRQRIAIARALALQPRLIVADEPVSALDARVRAQVLDLLAGLQRDLGLAMLFISHDLAVVRAMSDRIIVMKDGRIVEEGAAEEIVSRPQTPYTQELMRAAFLNAR